MCHHHHEIRRRGILAKFDGEFASHSSTYAGTGTRSFGDVGSISGFTESGQGWTIYEHTPSPPRTATTSVALCPLFVVCSRMDRDKLKRQLGETEEHVARSIQHVGEQWKLIARLEEKGQDTATSRRLLALLEESRDLHVADRDRLRRQLAQYPVPPEVPSVEGPPSASEDGIEADDDGPP